MRTRTAFAAGLLLLATAATACGKSEAEMQADCQKAITAATVKSKQRPDACKGLSKEDYNTIEAAWIVHHTYDGMSKKDRDTLDYWDDGSINGSLDDK
ncbi:hypothetical protein [Streptomyces sp. 900105245]